MGMEKAKNNLASRDTLWIGALLPSCNFIPSMKLLLIRKKKKEGRKKGEREMYKNTISPHLSPISTPIFRIFVIHIPNSPK